MSVIPTGSLGLDAALGIGGYPQGRIVELYGPESSGKTTLTLHAHAIGVDLSKLLVAQPDNAEQAMLITESLVRSGAVPLVVVNAVAAPAAVRERVVQARAVQAERVRSGEVGVNVNASLTLRDLGKVVSLDPAGGKLIADAVEKGGLRARAHDKVLRVARTIADLAGSASVKSAHVEEALGLVGHRW